jgi:hypothetical protein
MTALDVRVNRGASDLPALRRLALIRLEGRPADDPEVRALEGGLDVDPWVRPLLTGPERVDATGSRVPVHPYQKWRGAHWRLVALAELAVDREVPGAARAIDPAFGTVVEWLEAPGRLERARPVAGRARMCASQDGNALWAACRLGLAAHPAAARMASRLVAWQWPDGGWNCDPRPAATHASLHETWIPLRGLAAYAELGDDPGTRAASALATAAAADFLLRHRLVEHQHDGGVIDPSFLRLRWPPYWHYDLLAGLGALREAGAAHLLDPRAAAALGRLDRLRAADGRWHPGGRWWRAPGSQGSNVELVDWGADGEAAMLTLGALAICAAADAAAGADGPHRAGGRLVTSMTPAVVPGA